MSNDLNAVIITERSIGPYVADVTIEENATDKLAITQHPVENGAPITDHSYMLPAEVSIKVAFAAGQTPLREIYELVRALQSSREPFVIETGKRTYQNMMITSLGQSTDLLTENCLPLTFECREVIMVPLKAAKIPPRKAHKIPKKTAQTEQGGQKQPQAQKQTAIKALKQGFFG